MIKIYVPLIVLMLSFFISGKVEMLVSKSVTIDSLGACQGIHGRANGYFCMAIGKLGF